MIFMGSPTLNPNLKSFWQTRKLDDNTPVNMRVLHGGRMSSKSHDAAGMAIARANHHKEIFLCTRMYQNKIEDSVYTLLVDKISYFGLQDNFTVTAKSIENKTNGSVFKFYGIARNIEEIKSFEGATVWWNEESQNLTKKMFTTIRPTIMRNDGAEMWFTLNGQIVSDYSWQRLVESPPNGALVRQINYDENPFLTESALKDIAEEFLEDEELAIHIYNGIPYADDDQSIIKRSWVNACIDAHEKLQLDMFGNICAGYDVADSGADRNCVTLFNGAVAMVMDSWKAGEDELERSSIRAYKHLGDSDGLLSYDSIGVGAGVGSILKGHGYKNYSKFNAAAEVFNPDREYSPKITNKKKFENLKAQAWRDVADRMRNTFNAVTKGMSYQVSELISISSDIKNIEELKSELAAPRADYSKRGLDMVESKKEVKKRIEKSHDLADSFIMGACPHLVKRQSGRIKFNG
jgi:phage terminase large subunit